MLRRLIALCIALSATLFVSIPALAATRAPVAARSAADNVTQTLGSAKFYGTTAPVSLTAAAAPLAAAAAKGAAEQPGFRAAATFGHHAHKAARSSALTATLRPPSPAGTPVVNSIGAAVGFNGISHLDQRNAGTGIYASTNNNVEPPDQGLCAGNGFVVETVNDALAVYDENGNALTAATALNQFYNLLPFFNRVTGFVGDFPIRPEVLLRPGGRSLHPDDP